jgi:molybdenum cofactor cytidylyltransferase
MGAPKMLLPWANGTIISDVVSRVLAAVEPVVVVTGYEADATAEALADFDVQLVHNPGYAAGEMISSVKVGVAALPCDAEAFFLVLGDQPGIRPESFWQLIDARRRNVGAMIVSPTWNHRRGHPILISADGIDEILNLPANATLKTFVSRHAEHLIEIPVDDPAVCADVDTPEQYRESLRSASCPTESIAAAD